MHGEGGWYRVLFEQLAVGVAFCRKTEGGWVLVEHNRAFPPAAATLVLEAITNGAPFPHGTIRSAGPDERIVILDDRRFEQAFYGNAAAMVIAKQSDLRILDVNPRWLELFDTTREDVIGKTSVELGLLSEDTARARIVQHGAFPQGFDSELPLRTRKGAALTVLASAKPIDLEEGHCTLTTLIDITARKDAERAFATMFDASPAGLILIHDATGRTVAANRRLLEMTGFPYDHLVGQPIAALPVLKPTRAELLAEINRTGRLSNVEIEIRHADGHHIWTIASTERVVLRGAVHRLTAFIEITERKQLESELRVLNAELEARVAERTFELEETNLELESFSSSVSHDLRAPLRAMQGFAAVLLADHASVLPDQAKHYLARIKAGGERMGQLIENLLAFSRLGRTAVHRSEVDLDALVGSVVEELAAGHERLELRVGPLGTCIGDAGLLRVVWTNLVDNALKYTRERDQPVIEIGCEGRAYFIKDNGIGFDPSHSDRLFGMFQRLDTARGFEGTGVGLANVQRIIAKHGGKITATAEVGRGARFEFTLG